MANYNCAIRTNYFRVKDADKFKAFMSDVYGSEDEIEVFEETDKDGVTRYGFGCYGGISGVCLLDEDCEDSSYDLFIEGLQQFVADDDAIIILESGHEKLRYLVGSAEVITSKEYRYMRIEDFAISEAAKMLHNPKFTTRVAY